MCRSARERSMSACPDVPRIKLWQDSRKANDMLPGSSAIEFEVAWGRHQQLVQDGLHEQRKATHLPASGRARSMLSAIRASWASLLVGACLRLPVVPIDGSKGIETVAAQ